MTAAAVSGASSQDVTRSGSKKYTVDDASRYLEHIVVDEAVNIHAAVVASVAVAATSAQSAVLAKTDVVLISDTDCYVLASANPTAAAATSYPLKAFRPMRVKLAAADKIAVIRSTADGHLNIFDPA